MGLEDKFQGTSGVMGLEVFVDQFSKASPWAGKGEGGARFDVQEDPQQTDTLRLYLWILQAYGGRNSVHTCTSLIRSIASYPTHNSDIRNHGSHFS